MVHAAESRDLVARNNLIYLVGLGINNGNGCFRACNHVCKVNKLIQANKHLVIANHGRTRNSAQCTIFLIDVLGKVNICCFLESRRVKSRNLIAQSLFDIHLVLVNKLHCNGLRSRKLGCSSSLVSHLAILNFVTGKSAVHGIISGKYIDRAVEIHDRARIRGFSKILDNLGLVIRKGTNSNILGSFHHEGEYVLLAIGITLIIQRCVGTRVIAAARKHQAKSGHKKERLIGFHCFSFLLLLNILFCHAREGGHLL